MFSFHFTVKFVLMPSGQVTTMACALGQTMHELKEHLASELRMPADKLVFMFDGEKNINFGLDEKVLQSISKVLITYLLCTVKS